MQSTSFLPTLQSAGVISLVCSVVLLASCGEKKAAPAPSAPEVTVFTVTPKPLAITTELPGRTSPYLVAEVRPQVGGVIQKRLFVEGTDVKQGVSLYQIDPAIYQASYNSAKAALDKAQANLLTTQPKAQRYKELLTIEGVSHQDNDDANAANEQAKADIESAQAALETASINLKYTKVSSPISGRISQSTVTQGALVAVGQTNALTTVQQLDPIYVDLTQSSNDLMKLKQRMDSGLLKKTSDGQAKVTLLLADGSQYSLPGKLQFSDVTVDPSTGNVLLRALFPNPKGDLLPGMYVRAVLQSGIDDTAILVPQQGVTRNQQGQATTLLLNTAGMVEQRIITTSDTVGNQWLVTSGLKTGDRVIVEGLQKVKPGQPAVVAKAAPVAAGKPVAASATAQ